MRIKMILAFDEIKSAQSMKHTRNDINEMARIESLLKKIDADDIAYLDTISDEINQKQPFLLSLLLGYQNDISVLELEELLRIYLLIWNFFRNHPNVQTQKITEAMFEQMQDRNISMLRNTAAEAAYQKSMVFEKDLQNIASKALMSTIWVRFTTRPVLTNMEMKTKSIIMIGIKSLIECFEALCE